MEITGVDHPELNILSLFAGAGGLDLGVRLALERLGYRSRTVAYVEIEAHACALLGTRSEEQYLDAAPLWTDITTFPAQRFSGLVDLVIGGFPCPDLSVAGKRAGINGAKSGLWFEMLRIVREVRPEMVYAENVSGLLTDGNMDAVVCGLAESGYVGRWTSIRASDVGAPHQRDRVFILAFAEQSRWPQAGIGCDQYARREFEKRSGELADASGNEHRAAGLRETHGIPAEHRQAIRSGQLGGADPDMANAGEPRSQRIELGGTLHSDRRGQEAHGSVAELCGALFPPGPNELEAWADIITAAPWLAPALGDPKRLNPRFVEWLMGWPIGWTEMIDDENKSEIDKAMSERTLRLRATGNGVVPLQAAAAFVELFNGL